MIHVPCITDRYFIIRVDLCFVIIMLITLAKEGEIAQITRFYILGSKRNVNNIMNGRLMVFYHLINLFSEKRSNFKNWLFLHLFSDS